MDTKKYLLILVIVIVLFSAGVASFYFLKKSTPEPNNQNNEITNLEKPKETNITPSWQPKISIDEYYWKKELPYNDVAEKNIPEIIKAANNFISFKIGNEFFQKYIKYYPYQSKISNSGEIYYLHYIVTIPEKGIDFKTTTHPVEIELTINKDLTLVKPDQITALPDCNDVDKCLSYIDRDKAINTIVADMDKTGYRAQEILLDWSIHSLQWFMRYDLPNEKLPNCEFKMGGDVSIDYNSFNDKIIKRQENCNFPGV